MNYKKGEYLKYEDGYYAMIRAVLDENALISSYWKKENSDGYKAEQVAKAYRLLSFEELDEDCIICTAEDAGIKEVVMKKPKQWIPKKGEKYFYGYISDSLILHTGSHTWANDSIDKELLAVGNVHRTEEEALTFMKSKMK